jgi:hypothetical protein
VTELIAWKTVEQPAPDVKWAPRSWLSLQAGGEAPVILEAEEARRLGLDLAQIPAAPATVRLSLEILA